MKKFMFVVMLLPALLSAHPGHEGDRGSDGFTWHHFITSQEHWLPLIGAAALAIVVIRSLNRQKQNQNEN